MFQLLKLILKLNINNINNKLKKLFIRSFNKSEYILLNPENWKRKYKYFNFKNIAIHIINFIELLQLCKFEKYKIIKLFFINLEFSFINNNK